MAAIARRGESLPPGYYVRFGGQFEHLERGPEPPAARRAARARA